MSIHPIRGRPCVLTLDAFGTLFYPRQSIGQQYAEVARSQGLSGFTHHDIEASFRKAFKREKQEHPNYGKAVGMDPSRWWANVIRATFSPVLRSSVSLPKDLIPSLLDRFASNQGYQLYNDVIPFFQTLRQYRNEHRLGSGNGEDAPSLQLGIISNSDDRIPSILSSVGLQVCPRRHGSSKEAEIVHRRDFDIDWVILSYDTGTEKPDHGIFDMARSMSNLKGDDNTLFLHVGDNLDQDYWGARSAGWQSILLNRGGKNNAAPEIDQLTSLNSLQQLLFRKT